VTRVIGEADGACARGIQSARQLSYCAQDGTAPRVLYGWQHLKTLLGKGFSDESNVVVRVLEHANRGIIGAVADQ